MDWKGHQQTKAQSKFGRSHFLRCFGRVVADVDVVVRSRTTVSLLEQRLTHLRRTATAVTAVAAIAAAAAVLVAMHEDVDVVVVGVGIGRTDGVILL